MTYVLAIADLHVGSMFGLFPSGFVGSTGSVVQLNKYQEYLLQCWNDLVAALPPRIDVLIICGDAIDGQNHKQHAQYLCEVKPELQVQAAVTLLQPILERTQQTYLIRGSAYHTGNTGEWEEVLGMLINAERNGPWRTFSWLNAEIDGVLLDVAHKQSYTIRYSSAIAEREISAALERLDRIPGPLCVIRAHTHRALVLDMVDRMAICLPPWKMQDEFARMGISPNRTIPRWLGAVGLDISNGGINVSKFFYKHPEPDVIRIRSGESLLCRADGHQNAGVHSDARRDSGAHPGARRRRSRRDHQGDCSGAGRQ